ncbi:MAG: pectin acetylesterase-family hydrolase, partial [Anaeromyxobacteraceae bacterium]
EVSARRLALLAALAVACGGSTPGGPGARPFGAPAGSWTWVDVQGTSCSDGSPTGFGVNPGPRADLVVFLDGGGACWDYATCFVAQLAAPGPVGAAEFAVRAAGLGGTLFDRADPANPFRDFTFVFVPYCTGDLHAGDAEGSYSPGAGLPPRRWIHHGRVNVAADLARLRAELAAPPRLVVAGASAGGFGTLFSYDAFRAAFPASEASLVDDSGQPLEGDAFNPELRTRWRAAWNIDPVLDAACAGCRDDLSLIVPALVSRHPADRFALLSSTQDAVIRSFALLPPPLFEAALRKTVIDRFDPLPQARTFLVAGDAHVLVAAPARYTASGVTLTEWLRQIVERDPAWKSVGP